MAFRDELVALKGDLKEAGISVDAVLAIAGVNRSSWTRWGQGGAAKVDHWLNVKAAAEKLISERSGRRDAA